MNLPGLEGKVLLFNIGAEKIGSISLLCQRHGVIPVVIAPSDQNKELGELVGFHKGTSGAHDTDATCFTDEMMVFSMVTTLDSFLDDYKKMGLQVIALKAVLTPSNMKWTAVQLHTELKKEHEAFRKMGEN